MRRTTISFPNMFNNTNYKMQTGLSYSYKSTSESLRSLLLTTEGELLGDPEYGCRLRALLFDIKTPAHMSEVKSHLKSKIEKYIPHIVVDADGITIYNNPNNNKYKITISYYIPVTKETMTTDIII